MKYWMLVLIPVMALSIGCGKSYQMGTPIDKAKLDQIVPGTTTDAKVMEIFGEPFKKEMVAGDMTKYTYTYFEDQPRFWSKNRNLKQTMELYTQGGVVQKYDLKNEGINRVTEIDR
jgi:outer membrane protein assembly factor BamE (lipoprotein component of BamABCDE complex)